MKYALAFALFTSSVFAQRPDAKTNYVRYQPTFDDIKTNLSLTDDQLSQLKQMQQDKMTATQGFYTKMADKQKELNGLLEATGSDPSRIGQLMIELQQMRKQPPPSVTDIHERAVALLNGDQKQKLDKLEEAQKSRNAVDQAIQLSLLSPPEPARSAMPNPAMQGSTPQGMTPSTAKPPVIVKPPAPAKP